VAGVDVQQREREAAGTERLLGEAQQHERVLAAREQQRGVRALPGDLAQDVDRLGFEPVEVGEPRERARRRALGANGGLGAHGDASARAATLTAIGRRCSPHSRVSALSHHQRPERGPRLPRPRACTARSRRSDSRARAAR
jgi:hypothetical protein